ncbi:peptidoglycan-binding domain-containing protein [Tsuneonella sp. CC-YZS046]|uniref:peptidoglycan-binding domain-containing protein n=1 Tax=Tsuneonella sp. CC-YZS046 TaxID=3042152 RepID=UPI002D7A3C63|nr:peptidoglycan-binding domain-containing protein [Tsuneonella sp. CC-YZS046]WRO67623.1 peptidoglycan-binding domain-containing protein [Tsuneonella sp. CC-YZS046]
MQFGRMARAMALAGLASAAPAHAEDANKQFAVEGGGRASCQTFLNARKDQASAEYRQLIGFVQGYQTAANRYEPNTFDLSPWHNEAAFGLILEKHCTEYPRETLIGALQKLTISFRPIRIAQFSRLLEVGDGKNKAFVYEAILKRSQAFLRVRGLYNGPEDGAYSPALRDAFKRFQEQQKLPATGVPDPATLWTLLNP